MWGGLERLLQRLESELGSSKHEWGDELVFGRSGLEETMGHPGHASSGVGLNPKEGFVRVICLGFSILPKLGALLNGHPTPGCWPWRLGAALAECCVIRLHCLLHLHAECSGGPRAGSL